MVFTIISALSSHIKCKTTVKSITSYGVDGGGGLLYSNLVGMTPIPSGASTFINLDSGYSARTDTSSTYTVSNSTAGYTYANGTYNTLTSGAFGGGYYSYFPFNNYTNNGDPSWSSSNNWSGGTNTNFSTSVTSVGTVYGPWIQIQLPYTSYLFSYAIRTRGNDGVPKAWYIVGSTNGTTWTVIDNQTNGIVTTNTTTYNGFNTPTTAYSYYRMIIYQNNGSTYSSLIRFDLNGYLTGVPSDIKLINLVNWYKFDSADVTGSTVKDFITNTYNATLAGSATVSTTQSKFGGASLYVNGVSSSYCAIPAFTFSGTTGMSIAFWTYVTAYSAGHPPFKMAINSSATIASNYGQIIRPWYGTGPSNQNPITNFYVDTDNIDTPISGSSVTILNQWNHLVYILSGTVLKMYVNGSLYGSATLHTALQNITYNTFLIGSDVNYNGAQTAYFDDFRVYNAQITEAQVAAIYILGGYRYFKFEIVNVNDNGSGNYAGIQEIIIGYNNVKLSYTGATATDINNNGYAAEGPANAIDGTNSKWTTGFTSTNNPHPTLIVDFKTSQIVDSYTFVTGYDTSGRDPCSWILYGSYNNTNWTTLDTQNITPNQYGRSTQLPWYKTPSSDFTTFTNITSQAYTVTKKISGLSTATYNTNSGGNNGSVAVNMVQTKMLYGTAQGLWYAKSSDAGVTWSGLTLLQSATSGNAGGSCQISSDGTKGLYYCNGNFLYYVNWTNTTPTISTISSAVSFSWGSISMTPNGLKAVFGGNGTSAYYTTWNASTSTYNTPGIFNYGSNLTVPHMAIGISSDGTTLMADFAGTSGSNLAYLTISSWSTGNTPVPTITTNWQPLGSGTNLNLNGGSLCFLGGNTTFSPSTYVLGFTVGAPIYIYKWNNSTKTLTYSFTAVASTGFWVFGVQPCGSGGNIIYFIENTSAGTTAGTMNISSITLTTS